MNENGIKLYHVGEWVVSCKKFKKIIVCAAVRYTENVMLIFNDKYKLIKANYSSAINKNDIEKLAQDLAKLLSSG